MAGYLYKDFYLIRKKLVLYGLSSASMLALSLFMFFVVAGVSAEEQESQAIMAGLLNAAIVFSLMMDTSTGIFALDENRLWANYTIASPLGLRGYVGAKYGMVFLLLLLEFTWCFLGDLCVSFCSGIVINNTGYYLIVFFVQLLLQGIEAPFMIRFGYRYGSVVRIGFFLLVSTVAGGYLLFGDIAWLVEYGNPLDKLNQLIEELNSDTMNQWARSIVEKGLIAVALIPHGILLLYVLSYHLSVHLMRKGVETYET